MIIIIIIIFIFYFFGGSLSNPLVTKSLIQHLQEFIYRLHFNLITFILFTNFSVLFLVTRFVFRRSDSTFSNLVPVIFLILKRPIRDVTNYTIFS